MLGRLENIGLVINKKVILQQINFELKKGKITTLIGPNGGGKTSTGHILLGLIKQTSGKVLLEKGIKIGYMPQKIEICKTIPLTPASFLALANNNKKLDHLENFIDRLNVRKILNEQIHNLSGGELQKILFLHSIINKPDLLVLDEPTQYMDIAATEDFYNMIDQIRKESNCSILLISHDLHLVMQSTDFVFCINRHICCHGSPESINQHPEYLSLFSKNNSLAVYQHHHNHQH